MTNALLIDFGATHIKSIVVNKRDFLKNSLFISKGSAFEGREVPFNFFSDSLIYHLKNANKVHKISSIVMCCEMHGFFYKSFDNISNYFSWRYSNKHSYHIIKDVKNKNWFKNINIFPRPGIPIITLISLARKSIFKKKIKILFIPQLICEILGYSKNIVHASLGQASGFYLKNNNINDILKIDIDLPTISNKTLNFLGEIKFKKEDIPVYGGYGDLQTALCDIKNNEWNINLGTGSQIAVKTKESIDGFETRAFFNGNSLQCISHLPAGRSLDLIANFMKIIREDKNTNYFWKKMGILKYKKSILKNSLLNIDLNFFEQNKNYIHGGFIKNIKENSFDLNSFLVSTVYSMTKNYADIVNKTKFSKEKNIINVYGSLGNNIPIIKPLLKELTGYKVNIKKFNIDPTLENMKNLYKNN